MTCMLRDKRKKKRNQVTKGQFQIKRSGDEEGVRRSSFFSSALMGECRADTLTFVWRCRSRRGVERASLSPAVLLCIMSVAPFALWTRSELCRDQRLVWHASNLGSAPVPLRWKQLGRHVLAHKDDKLPYEEAHDRSDTENDDKGRDNACSILALVEKIVGVKVLFCVGDVCHADVAGDEKDDKEEVRPGAHGFASQEENVEVDKDEVERMYREILPGGTGRVVRAILQDDPIDDCHNQRLSALGKNQSFKYMREKEAQIKLGTYKCANRAEEERVGKLQGPRKAAREPALRPVAKVGYLISMAILRCLCLLSIVVRSLIKRL